MMNIVGASLSVIAMLGCLILLWIEPTEFKEG